MLIVRHRRATLVGGAAVLVILALAHRGALLLAAAVALTLLAWYLAERPRTPSMPGFTTPRGPALILAGLAHFALIAACLSLGLGLAGPDRTAWVVLLIATLTPLPFYGYGLWHGTGVTFTPTGVRADKLAGTLFYPWSALAETQPRNDLDGEITVAFLEEPETTGRPANHDTLIFDKTSAAFVAAALRFYAAHPAERPKIGTPEAYRRLIAGIAAEPDRPLPAPTPRPATRDTAIGLTVIAAATTIGLWTAWHLTGHGLIALLPQVMLLPALFGIALIIRARATP
ncbi:hypothetical protein [Paractinoplanes atraurantiacus]|uniref:PH domain-containing protein n=1 Tax=Paractinoplanes atraurantiacus TaxID=1036182 RepID=A0A285IUF2_9ACTN|nr:hypothetical protein [Actinoplanes atraurantiacus]SNY51639.1 hypothetical protein SAMN05421748_11242 [Actinoplanes atraurantiacus]